MGLLSMSTTTYQVTAVNSLGIYTDCLVDAPTARDAIRLTLATRSDLLRVTRVKPSRV